MTFHQRPNPFLSLAEPRYRRFVLTLLDTLQQADLESAGDLTTTTLGLADSPGSAAIKAKAPGVLAGLAEVTAWLEGQGVTCVPHLTDGARLTPGERILELQGSTQTLLRAERTALNALQRLSGIATQTHELSAKLKSTLPMNNELSTIHIPPLLAATRKTPWGYLDKRAVELGGGWSHRLGLWDAILIKDNHLSALGLAGESNPILVALERVLAAPSRRTFVELEVRSAGEVERFIAAAEALSDRLAGVPFVLMLDNFTPDELQSLLPTLRERLAGLRVFFEISGGITAANLLDFAALGADIISLGSLTHSTQALDLSMEF